MKSEELRPQFGDIFRSKKYNHTIKVVAVGETMCIALECPKSGEGE